MASGEGTVVEGGHDQRPCPAEEAYRLEDLACQDDVLVEVDVVVLDHTLVAEQGSRQVRLGLVGDPVQAQSLAGVGIPEGDDQDQVLGPYQVAPAEVAGHVRGLAEVGVAVAGDLDAADPQG